jgi:AAA domain
MSTQKEKQPRYLISEAAPTPTTTPTAPPEGSPQYTRQQRDFDSQHLDFAGLLETLALTAGEYLSINHQPAGGAFQSQIVPFGEDVPARAQALADGNNLWFGINPVRGGIAGRGTEADVTRLAAVWADLDIKPGGCADLDVTYEIVGDLSALIGTRPSAVTHSGHGLQPMWVIEDGRIGGEFTTGQAAALLRRWGRLVARVANDHGAKVDSVYDLPRVLRIPGSTNYKSDPVPVTCEADTGGPMTIDELDERLDEAGIHELDDGRGHSAGEVVSPMAGWSYAKHDCIYTKTMVDRWNGDSPPARHPWLISQAVRIAAAHRNGCLTAELHRQAVGALETRFRELCARPGDARPVPRYEIQDALAEGVRKASMKTEAELAVELGKHVHLEQLAGGSEKKVEYTSSSPQAGDHVTQPKLPVEKFRLTDGSTALKPVASLDAKPADTPPAGQPKPKLRLIKASSIPITLPEWVWAYGDHGRISRSALTLFAGRPGAGKSTCTRWFAAGWSRGTLSGCWEGKPVNVAYVATEEHWQSVVAPSLQAAGADMDRVLFLARGDDPARIKSVDDETELTELLVDNDIRVVCLDPLMSTLTSGADLYKSNEVREALDPWVRIAEKIDGVVLGVAHLVKTAASGDVVAAINGSSAFGEVARCVFGFAVDRQADDGTRVLSQGKNSAGYDGLNLSYRIEAAPIVAADGRRGEVARFVLGDPTNTSVSDLMMAEGKQKRPMSAGQFLEAWFDTHPETEWIPVTDIVSAGERFGHTEDALARARDRRGYQTGKDALHWYWGTPDAAPLDAADTGGAHRGGHGRFTSRRPA